MLKTILVTGGTSGIGLETVRQLCHLKHRVIFTARDPLKAERVLSDITETTGHRDVSFRICRMDSLAAVASFAELFSREFTQLDVLINNAGVWETRRKESADGIEMTWAVNHLAPFLLTQRLMPLLRNAGAARIITLASEAHRNTLIQFDDPELKKAFPFMRAYSQSKLANVLFTRLLAEKLTGSTITANCVHPGVVLTPIFDKMNPLLKAIFRIYMISPAKGAQPSVRLATAEELEGISGKYFKRLFENPGSAGSRDMEAARRLWGLSLEYVAEWLPPDLRL